MEIYKESSCYIKFADIKASVSMSSGVNLSLEQFLNHMSEIDRGYSTFDDLCMKEQIIEEITQQMKDEAAVENFSNAKKLKRLKEEIVKSDIKKGPFFAYVYVDTGINAFIFDCFCAEGICSIVYEL